MNAAALGSKKQLPEADHQRLRKRGRGMPFQITINDLLMFVWSIFQQSDRACENVR